MLRIAIIILTMITSCLAFAQLSPKKIKNSNFRTNKKEILSIAYTSNNKEYNLNISKTTAGQFYLQQKEDSKITKSLKLDSDKAMSIDEQFADKFILIKYMMNTKVKNKCNDFYKLFMHGEDYQVCSDDKERMSVVLQLKKLFKKKLI